MVYEAICSVADSVLLACYWRVAGMCLSLAGARVREEPCFAGLPARGSIRRDFDSSRDHPSREVGARPVPPQLGSLSIISEPHRPCCSAAEEVRKCPPLTSFPSLLASLPQANH